MTGAMTGADLKKWIQDNHAENLEFIIEHRDSGGSYWTAERLEKPVLCSFSNESYGVINKIDFDGKTAVML